MTSCEITDKARYYDNIEKPNKLAWIQIRLIID